MPTLELTDIELRDSAQAARLACRRAHQDGALQPNPAIKNRFMADAARYRAFGQKFDEARQPMSER
jgi:hypothetical protein